MKRIRGKQPKRTKGLPNNRIQGSGNRINIPVFVIRGLAAGILIAIVLKLIGVI